MRRIGITLGLLLAACSDPCTAAGVQTQLDGAGVGGVVTLPACRVEGELTVPDGVTLRGVPGSELASAAPRDIVVELRAGAALRAGARGKLLPSEPAGQPPASSSLHCVARWPRPPLGPTSLRRP